jgi:hypothetical protein
MADNLRNQETQVMEIVRGSYATEICIESIVKCASCYDCSAYHRLQNIYHWMPTTWVRERRLGQVWSTSTSDVSSQFLTVPRYAFFERRSTEPGCAESLIQTSYHTGCAGRVTFLSSTLYISVGSNTPCASHPPRPCWQKNVSLLHLLHRCWI